MLSFCALMPCLVSVCFYVCLILDVSFFFIFSFTNPFFHRVLILSSVFLKNLRCILFRSRSSLKKKKANSPFLSSCLMLFSIFLNIFVLAALKFLSTILSSTPFWVCFYWLLFLLVCIPGNFSLDARHYDFTLLCAEFFFNFHKCYGDLFWDTVIWK